METTHILIGVITLLFVVLMLLCYRNKNSSKSSFGEKTSTKSPSIKDDTVVIVYAPWCGHCNAAKPEFDAAVQRGNGKVIALDATDKDNKSILESLKNVSGYPTIVKGDGTKFEGSRTADDIIKFADEK